MKFVEELWTGHLPIPSSTALNPAPLLALSRGGAPSFSLLHRNPSCFKSRACKSRRNRPSRLHYDRGHCGHLCQTARKAIAVGFHFKERTFQATDPSVSLSFAPGGTFFNLALLQKSRYGVVNRWQFVGVLIQVIAGFPELVSHFSWSQRSGQGRLKCEANRIAQTSIKLARHGQFGRKGRQLIAKRREIFDNRCQHRNALFDCSALLQERPHFGFSIFERSFVEFDFHEKRIS